MIQSLAREVIYLPSTSSGPMQVTLTGEKGEGGGSGGEPRAGGGEWVDGSLEIWLAKIKAYIYLHH